jgi:hypothetical protein
MGYHCMAVGTVQVAINLVQGEPLRSGPAVGSKMEILVPVVDSCLHNRCAARAAQQVFRQPGCSIYLELSVSIVRASSCCTWVAPTPRSLRPLLLVCQELAYRSAAMSINLRLGYLILPSLVCIEVWFRLFGLIALFVREGLARPPHV